MRFSKFGMVEIRIVAIITQNITIAEKIMIFLLLFIFPPPFWVYYSIPSRKCKEKLLGTRVLACGENSHALRLTSELVDLRAANANLAPQRFALRSNVSKR